MEELKKKLFDLVAKDRLEEVFAILSNEDFENHFKVDLLLIQSRYVRLQKENIRGTLSREAEMIAKNQMVSSLLSIINDIEEPKSTESKPFENKEKKEIKAFISYSHKDEKYRGELETSLALLKRQGLLNTWTDRKIQPGQIWRNEISSNLEDSDLIIFLISPDFIASDYSYEIELQRAIEKHDKQEAIVIPIIIRHSLWQNSPIGNFQALPTSAKPIAAWGDKDEAWLDVAEGIRNICLSFNNQENEKRSENNKLDSLRLFKVGVFGETGTGKSTLCNAILESEVMRVSDIFPVTKGIHTAQKAINSKIAIQLSDFPGVGESVEGDKRYEELYTNGFKELDIIIWVLRSDVRNYRMSQNYIDRILELNINQDKEFIIALSMVDRMDVVDKWDEVNGSPSKGLLSMIERKTMYVSGILRVPPEKIIPVSGLRGYNINNLQYTMIEYLEKIK